MGMGTPRLEMITVANGDVACIAHVTLWHGSKDNSFGPFTGAAPSIRRNALQKDAPKMAVTDGLTKALSHLGIQRRCVPGRTRQQVCGRQQALQTENGNAAIGC